MKIDELPSYKQDQYGDMRLDPSGNWIKKPDLPPRRDAKTDPPQDGALYIVYWHPPKMDVWDVGHYLSGDVPGVRHPEACWCDQTGKAFEPQPTHFREILR
jgi:hypothetical protein